MGGGEGNVEIGGSGHPRQAGTGREIGSSESKDQSDFRMTFNHMDTAAGAEAQIIRKPFGTTEVVP